MVQLSAANAGGAKNMASKKPTIMAEGKLMAQARCQWF